MATPDRPADGPRPVTALVVVAFPVPPESRRHLTALVRAVDPDSFAVELCVVGTATAPVADLVRPGVRVHHCRPGAWFGADFARLLRRLRPGVLHVVSRGRAGTALTVARAAGVPLRILYLHVDPTPRARLRPDGRGPSRAATHVIAASETAMRAARGTEWRVDRRCRILYPGLEPEPYGVAIAARRRGLDIARQLAIDEPVSVLHVSGSGPDSGRLRAVAVLAAVRARGVDATLTMVGARDRHSDERVLRAAAAHGVGEYVDLTGERDDLPRLAVAASLLLVTAAARTEMPTIVLEACAVGTPVLAAETPGIAEISRLLPGITMMPRSAPDGVWADAALDRAVVAPTLDERREALRVFCRSPFTVDRWFQSLSALSPS
ncbi:MAG: glycosyltransferase [Frankia sp.]